MRVELAYPFFDSRSPNRLTVVDDALPSHGSESLASDGFIISPLVTAHIARGLDV